MITTVKTSSVVQGMPKYRSMLAGNSAYIPSSYESIATATGTGSSGTITFSSIPSTFKHLQIRCLARTDGTNMTGLLTFNSDTGANYSRHELIGSGSSASAGGAASTSNITVIRPAVSTTGTNTMGVGIIDILDYGSTTNNKTVRSFAGVDNNAADTNFQVYIRSGVWQSTSAVTSISIVTGAGNWTTASTFALYGIKEA